MRFTNLIKNFVFFLSLIVLFNSCDSDNSDKANTFTSDIVIDGNEFKPSTGYFGHFEQDENDLHHEMFFRMEMPSGNGQSDKLHLRIYVPFSMTNITGTYSFGPGTADEFLVSGEYTRGTDMYAIIGETVHITDLGDSKYKFQFLNMQALYLNNNFEEKVFSGTTIEGQFTFEE